jgi:tetratricopeptide (TPR) repeat protein
VAAIQPTLLLGVSDMERAAAGSNGFTRVGYETVTELEVDAIDITYDERFLYAACRDQMIRVWSKESWQLVAELGETVTEPLAVDVDETQVYATCEKRVYVWNKESWGMIGWFELSYQAVTAALYGDYFFVGARDGRLVAIQKDTHEPNSWQLHKSDITSLWSDDKIICTSTRKEEPRVWLKAKDAAPSELARLDVKGKGGVVSGNAEFVMVGTAGGEVAVYDRVEYDLVKTLEPEKSHAVHALWASNYYLVSSSSNGTLVLWDLKQGEELGSINLEGHRVQWVTADHDLLYIATSGGVFILRLIAGGQPLDICSEGPALWKDSLLKTSPYDVLESAIQLEKRGDECYQDGVFHDAVVEYEKALQLLIDNTHTLLEVPEERQILTDELNDKLGKALLRSKMEELSVLSLEIRQLTEELEVKHLTDMDPEDVDKLWASAGRAIKESRVLAEAQASDMLSYQLSNIVDTLDVELQNAMEKYSEFRETINQALALTRRISNEWRWMERKRTTLAERKEYLEGAIAKLTDALKNAEEASEVHKVLSSALEDYKRLYTQIERIVTSRGADSSTPPLEKDEAKEVIEGLISIAPKRIGALSSIADERQRELERKRILTALEEGLETAKSFKMGKQQEAIQKYIEEVTNAPE